MYLILKVSTGSLDNLLGEIFGNLMAYSDVKQSQPAFHASIHDKSKLELKGVVHWQLF